MPTTDVALATTMRLLLVLARLEIAPETYRRMADAVPLVGRDARQHDESARVMTHWACWASKIRYLYTRQVCGGDLVWHRRCVRWQLYQRSHRGFDLPAHVYDDGSRYWYRLGVWHRDGDLPAAMHHKGTEQWFRNGKVHRDSDKPAIIWEDGDAFWYQNGVQHRDGDKPAVVRARGRVEYWRNGTRHFPNATPTPIA